MSAIILVYLVQSTCFDVQQTLTVVGVSFCRVKKPSQRKGSPWSSFEFYTVILITPTIIYKVEAVITE